MKRTLFFVVLCAAGILVPARAYFKGLDDLVWGPKLRLEWSHFKGRAPAGSPMDAMTDSGIEYVWGCNGGVVNGTVFAKFHPYSSWYKPGASEKLLQHERLHFDITELHARKLRKALLNFACPCATAEPKVKAMARSVLDEWHGMEDRYDRETNHSNHSGKQAEWAKFVAGELKKTEGFAR